MEQELDFVVDNIPYWWAFGVRMEIHYTTMLKILSPRFSETFHRPSKPTDCVAKIETSNYGMPFNI